MNNLTTTPTAYLIAEWNELSYKCGIYHVDKCNICGHEQRSANYWSRCDKCDSTELTHLQLSDESKARKSAIATELDRRATESGISIYENQFVYNTTEFWITHGRFLEHDIMAIAANGNMPAKEQHDLEGWLILKEGGGDA